MCLVQILHPYRIWISFFVDSQLLVSLPNRIKQYSKTKCSILFFFCNICLFICSVYSVPNSAK